MKIRDLIKNVYPSLGKVYFILVWFKRNLNFLSRFSKNTEISNSMKIRPVGTQLVHAGRRTDTHDQAISRYSQICENA
jgi:hypothetical protein